ncbi:MAG TPA: hypothetical protein VJ997_01810 [Longimicrobiales bacterium]|nr:hypothetical protein [Longimicrobiales bacterium]
MPALVRSRFLLALLLVLLPAPLSGQYFGRNKVQYEDLDFSVMETPNFDLYFYARESNRAVRDASRMAERWHERPGRFFGGGLHTRKPLRRDLVPLRRGGMCQEIRRPCEAEPTAIHENREREPMATIQSERDEYATLIGNRVEALDQSFARMMRQMLKENDMEILVRVERAKKSVAEKGAALHALLEAASDVPADDWADAREDIQGAWTEYAEAVDRARLELERSSELS